MHEDITRMRNIATDPTLFHVLIEHDAIPLFVQLLTHDNMDIRLDVIGLLADMTDVERVGEMEFAQALVENIMTFNGFRLICDNLSFLLRHEQTKHRSREEKYDHDYQTQDDENDDDDVTRIAVYNVLQIIENVAEIAPASCSAMCTSTNLLDVLLLSCQTRTNDKRHHHHHHHRRRHDEDRMTENKLYCSEILSILIQATDEAAREMSKDRLDLLLTALAVFRKMDHKVRRS